MSKTAKICQPVLGTAQLGQAASGGSASGRDPRLMLDIASSAGVTWLETSPVYGSAEQCIGQSRATARRMRIITRLAPLPQGATRAEVRDAVIASVRRSCNRMATPRLDVVMLHDAGQKSAFDGLVWRTLRELRDDGTIFTLGLPLQDPASALHLIDDPDIGYMQLRFSALDRQWHRSGLADALTLRPDMIVHAHSPLMQGLLAANPGTGMAGIPGIDMAALHRRLWMLARDLGRDCPADLCIAYVRAQSWLDGVIVGAGTPAQLALNMARFRRPALTEPQVDAVDAALQGFTAAAPGHSQWRRAA